MLAHRKRIVNLVLLVTGLIWLVMATDWLRADEPGLTFFGWSDQHVTVSGDGQHLLPAIDAMNSLPGQNYPAAIGGSVVAPAFVLGCGDISEWPTAAARDTYAQLITKRLKFPSYDVVGNHDEGGQSPSETIKNWIRARHGELSYTFDRGGVHFIILFSKYDESLHSPAQPVSPAALTFLRADLAKSDPGTPVVVALHLCFDAITNREEFVAALGDANVLLVLSGHYHKAKVDRFRGVNFVQLPSPAPNGSHEVTVIRITAVQLIAAPYQYKSRTWSEGPGKVLNVPIRGPAAPLAGRP